MRHPARFWWAFRIADVIRSGTSPDASPPTPAHAVTFALGIAHRRRYDSPRDAIRLNRPHRRTIRRPTYDPRDFVTICTHGRECILDNEPFRALLSQVWLSIVGGSIDSDDGDFVIMPNHVHGVVLLDDAASGARHRTSSVDRGRHDDQNVLGGPMSSRMPRPYGRSLLPRRALCAPESRRSNR